MQSNDEKKDGVPSHITFQGYHSKPLIYIVRNIHVRIHPTSRMAFLFFNLDFLLSDGSGRVVIIIVVVRRGSVICSCDRPETAKRVVRNPCQIKFANVWNVKGLIEEVLSLKSFFEG